MIGDAECQVHHGDDPATGPDLPPEAIGFGAAVQQREQARERQGMAAGAGPLGRLRGRAASTG
jgi:hypothetical protein